MNSARSAVGAERNIYFNNLRPVCNKFFNRIKRIVFGVKSARMTGYGKAVRQVERNSAYSVKKFVKLKNTLKFYNDATCLTSSVSSRSKASKTCSVWW